MQTVMLLAVVLRWRHCSLIRARPVEKHVVRNYIGCTTRRGDNVPSRWLVDDNRLAPFHIDLQSCLLLPSLWKFKIQVSMNRVLTLRSNKALKSSSIIILPRL